MRFPQMVHSCIIVNTPMFFENFFNQEVKPLIGVKNIGKVHLTGESTPEELTASVPLCNLPKVYGGQCTCQATCIYSEKGPWTNILNTIDWQNQQMTTTEAEFFEERANHHSEEFKNML